MKKLKEIVEILSQIVPLVIGGQDGGPGSGQKGHTTAENSGENIHDKLTKLLDAPSHAMKMADGISWAKSESHADAVKSLKNKGFKKEASKQNTESSKLGRSAAHSTTKHQTSTFIHPDGHSVEVKTSTAKYGGQGPTSYYSVKAGENK